MPMFEVGQQVYVLKVTGYRLYTVGSNPSGSEKYPLLVGGELYTREGKTHYFGHYMPSLIPATSEMYDKLVAVVGEKYVEKISSNQKMRELLKVSPHTACVSSYSQAYAISKKCVRLIIKEVTDKGDYSVWLDSEGAEHLFVAPCDSKGDVIKG